MNYDISQRDVSMNLKCFAVQYSYSVSVWSHNSVASNLSVFEKIGEHLKNENVIFTYI